MPRKSDGSGTLYLRGDIWWVKIRVDGRPVYESSKSTKKSEAIKLRDKMLAKKSRGELSGGSADKVLITDLLDDVLKSDIKPSTRYVWEKVIEKGEAERGGEKRRHRQPRTLDPEDLLPQRPQAHAAESAGRAVFPDRCRNQYSQGFPHR
jgi:hypothetical protein